MNNTTSRETKDKSTPCGIILNNKLFGAGADSVKVVFLDRDGVINVNRDDYVKSWDEFEFIAGAKEAIRLLNDNNYWVIIITNQSPIGRGIFSHERLREIHELMLKKLADAGAHIDAIYYCPHSPDDHCECRKPKPGLLFQAADELGIDLQSSWFIGDSEGDFQAGEIAGCKIFKVSDNTGLLEIVKSLLTSE